MSNNLPHDLLLARRHDRRAACASRVAQISMRLYRLGDSLAEAGWNVIRSWAILAVLSVYWSSLSYPLAAAMHLWYRVGTAASMLGREILKNLLRRCASA